ncbi:MAG: type II secretion system inner membrane protein GspF [Gammaproteobacteria bacterium]
MPAFEYSALDARGATNRGLIEADSERQARRVLRERELVPLSVRATSARRGGGLRLFARRGLSGEELALFTRLLGTLLASGLALDDALALIARQAEHKHVERTVLDVRTQVLEGHSLEQAFGSHADTFPDVFRATVGAGERSRHLPLVLGELAAYVEARERIRQRIRVALIYPAVLTVTALAVVAGLLTYVVPEVVRVFDDVGRELPLATRTLIALSDFTRAWGLVLLAIVLGGVALARRALRREGVRRRVHGALMRLPVLGGLLVETECAKFARTLGILLGSGVDMLDALAIAAKSVVLVPLRDALSGVVVRVREGAALGQSLRDTGIAPPLLSHLVTSGEQSGELSRMLDTAAQTFDHKNANAVAVALGLFEPLLIFLMGGIVLFVVVAILLPIFEMNQLV